MVKKFYASDLRINIVLGAFCAFSVLLVVRLFIIQVVQHADYRVQAQEQYWNLQEIPAKRGDILSQDGYPLATTQVAYLMYGEPKKIADPFQVSTDLATILAEYNVYELDDPFTFHQQKIHELLSKDLFWVKLENTLTPEQKQRIEELKIEGIGFEEEPKRYYPETYLASHVLGFVGSDEHGEKQGYFGIEGRLNGDLKGRPGRIIEEQDALGLPILVGGYKRIDSIDGSDVVLTLNRAVQFLVEKQLKEGVETYDAVSGSVIVMDPFTGDIIAMANFPTYDPANFNDFGEEVTEVPRRKAVERTNLAISQTYEPGSVIKALTVSSAIDTGKVNPNTVFVDSGPVQYSDYVIDNWNGQHHGPQTIIQLLQKSNNIGAAWVGHQVGSETLAKYFTDFGLGVLSEIELEGEDTGVIRDPDTWTDIDLATNAFGQGLSATPLQVLNAFNVIANGGNLMRPRIVASLTDEDGVKVIPTKVVRRVLSQESSDTMVDLLTQAVEGGESKYYNIKNYKVAGKTGTAQIPFNGKYDPSKTNATFVGFLPTSRKYSMIVKLEEPSSSIYAAETAVPLWMGITEELVKYYGIPADKAPEPEQVVSEIP